MQIKGQLVTMMQRKLESHKASALSWTNLLIASKADLNYCKLELDGKKKRHATVPQRVSKLKALLVALASERNKLEYKLADQITEVHIVAEVLSKQCDPVTPMYVLTSTTTVISQATVTSCPICCNGYHCNNWVAASCGHTYHPVCLFTHLTSVKSNLKCIACMEPLHPDWWQS
jgi:hypothetical protein